MSTVAAVLTNLQETRVKIAAFDPGLTTGYVLYDTQDKCVIQHAQFTDPMEIAKAIYDGRNDVDALVVEAFPGSGPRTTEAITTLKLLGFIEFFATSLGMTVIVQQPQRRIAFVKAAKAVLGDQRHAADALAHALAHEWAILTPK